MTRMPKPKPQKWRIKFEMTAAEATVIVHALKQQARYYAEAGLESEAILDRLAKEISDTTCLAPEPRS